MYDGFLEVVLIKERLRDVFDDVMCLLEKICFRCYVKWPCIYLKIGDVSEIVLI